MTRKRIQFIISLFITAFFLWLAFRNVPLENLWAALGDVKFIYAVPFMAITIVSMFFRTLRWKYLLEPVVDVPSRRLFSPLIICFALNSILPGRAGEFARAYLVARDHRTKFSSALATVIVERMADGLGLLALFVVIIALVDFGNISIPWDTRGEILGSKVVLWTTVGLLVVMALLLVLAWLVRRAARQKGRGAEQSSGMMDMLGKIGNPQRAVAACLILAGLCVAAIVALGAGLVVESGRTYRFGSVVDVDGPLLRSSGNKLLFVCLVMLAGALLMLWGPFRRFVQGVISWTPVVPRGLKDGLNRFIESFVEGFRSLRNPRLVFWVVVHTGTVWLTVGLSLVVMSYGFPAAMHLSLVQGMGVAIIICVAILIPAAPGYWGLYEVGCILACLVLGVVEIDPSIDPQVAIEQASTQALSFSLVAHFFQILPILTLGLYFMWKRQVGLSELTRAEAQEDGE